MRSFLRYPRLVFAFGKFGLAREMAFRGNFLVKVFVEILWLLILLVFYQTIFSKTSMVADWSESEYLFFLGCYFSMEGVIETFFLENCNEFADLVRNGDLDVLLLKPIDEQFLVTCRQIDWSTAPNFFMGTGLMGVSLHQMGWTLDAGRLFMFSLMFLCGVGIAYSFLVLLTSTAVWFVRNQSVMEMWWLFTSLMRYPKEIFAGKWAAPMGWFFTFVLPILLVINIPARVMVKAMDPYSLIFTLVATALLLALSRKFFRFSLARYRSASS